MIALAPFHVTTPHVIDLKLLPPLAQELDLYRRLYKETYGAEVSEPDLIREIIRAFLDRDEGFRQYKQTSPPNPVRGRARSKTAASERSDSAASSNGDGLPPFPGRTPHFAAV